MLDDNVSCGWNKNRTITTISHWIPIIALVQQLSTNLCDAMNPKYVPHIFCITRSAFGWHLTFWWLLLNNKQLHKMTSRFLIRLLNTFQTFERTIDKVFPLQSISYRAAIIIQERNHFNCTQQNDDGYTTSALWFNNV